MIIIRTFSVLFYDFSPETLRETSSPIQNVHSVCNVWHFLEFLGESHHELLGTRHCVLPLENVACVEGYTFCSSCLILDLFQGAGQHHQSQNQQE